MTLKETFLNVSHGWILIDTDSGRLVHQAGEEHDMSRIELTKKWWNANRPKDVKGPELEKALAAVEQSEGESHAAALAAVPGVIARVSKGLDKKAQKDLLKSLDALSALAEAEAKKALAEAKAQAEVASKAKAESPLNDEEETPEDKLFDPDFLRSVLGEQTAA